MELIISDSNMGASGSSSPTQADQTDQSQQHTTLKSMLTTGQIPKSSFNNLVTVPVAKNSLFDEGLRIAQQYGLGDFAQELKTLQGSPEKNEVQQSELVENLCTSGLLNANQNGATNGDRISPKHIVDASTGDIQVNNSPISPAKEAVEHVEKANGV